MPHKPVLVFKTNVRRMLIPVVIFISAIMSCSQAKKPDSKVTTVEKMQQFVIDISAYAKKIDPDFIIIPQNGIELAFDKANPELKLNKKYLNAIDGFGVEELFYYEELAIDTMRLNALQKLVKQKRVLVSDYLKHDRDISDAEERNTKEGFIPYVRTESNYHYHTLPKKIINENADDITKMSQVKNYLYLINSEDFDSKEDFIKAISETNYDLITIDLYFDGTTPYKPEELEQMKTKANGGKRLIVCYMNIGAAENWRSYWKSDWELYHPEFIKRKYDGYDNEFWVEYWNPEWQKIIFGSYNSYLKKIMDAGFDGTYLDNTEAYYELYKK
jgi:cysteinyl-tRNA synthetase